MKHNLVMFVVHHIVPLYLVGLILEFALGYTLLFGVGRGGKTFVGKAVRIGTILAFAFGMGAMITYVSGLVG